MDKMNPLIGTAFGILASLVSMLLLFLFSQIRRDLQTVSEKNEKLREKVDEISKDLHDRITQNREDELKWRANISQTVSQMGTKVAEVVTAQRRDLDHALTFVKERLGKI